MEDGEVVSRYGKWEHRRSECNRCGRWGHDRGKCVETHNVNSAPLRNTMCLNCGTYGHHRKVCWIKNVQRPWCEKCAAFGHVKGRCRATILSGLLGARVAACSATHATSAEMPPPKTSGFTDRSKAAAVCTPPWAYRIAWPWCSTTVARAPSSGADA
ncbi:unnamed protein product [Pylaiella littoralis]